MLSIAPGLPAEVALRLKDHQDTLDARRAERFNEVLADREIDDDYRDEALIALSGDYTYLIRDLVFADAKSAAMARDALQEKVTAVLKQQLENEIAIGHTELFPEPCAEDMPGWDDHRAGVRGEL